MEYITLGRLEITEDFFTAVVAGTDATSDSRIFIRRVFPIQDEFDKKHQGVIVTEVIRGDTLTHIDDCHVLVVQEGHGGVGVGVDFDKFLISKIREIEVEFEPKPHPRVCHHNRLFLVYHHSPLCLVCHHNPPYLACPHSLAMEEGCHPPPMACHQHSQGLGQTLTHCPASWEGCQSHRLGFRRCGARRAWTCCRTGTSYHQGRSQPPHPGCRLNSGTILTALPTCFAAHSLKSRRQTHY